MKLREIQRRFAAALLTPLTLRDHISRRTREGVSMTDEAARLVKRNCRLTSLERLEIYSRSYWFRVRDGLREDFPGLRAVLGAAAFDRMANAYLAECPSRSFTLRDLGSQLAAWLQRNPRHAGRNPRLAMDMVRLEWAHVAAFDGKDAPVLTQEDLSEFTPALRVGVQPYVALLELEYPVDEMRLAAKRKARRGRCWVAVHRIDGSVYYRRLEPEEFRLLTALRRGKTVAGAIREAFAESPISATEIPARLQTWFGVWAELGWLTRKAKRKEKETLCHL